MKSTYLDIALALALGAVVVSGFAYTWNSANNTTTGINGPLGMSADGRVICAVSSASRPSVSTNWGQTFTVATNNSLRAPSQGHVAVSADGTKIVAYLLTNGLAGGIFATYDYGANWTKMNVPGLPSSAAISLASSADGSKLIAGVANGPAFFSTNSGANWRTSSVPNLNWVSMASSADGGRIIGAVSGSFLLLSMDFGVTWFLPGLPVQTWKSVCISGDGKWVGAVGSLGTYISSNAATSWTTNKIGGNNNTIACSANGSTWMITGSQVYTSTDSAATWQTNLSSGQWNNGAVSADGCELIAVGTPGGTMIGRVTPSPELGIQVTNGVSGISWLIPSTNFVLQQSGDLTSTDWLPVAGSPVLNFTNLNYEIAVPNRGSNGFFRLIAQ